MKSLGVLLLTTCVTALFVIPASGFDFGLSSLFGAHKQALDILHQQEAILNEQKRNLEEQARQHKLISDALKNVCGDPESRDYLKYVLHGRKETSTWNVEKSERNGKPFVSRDIVHNLFIEYERCSFNETYGRYLLTGYQIDLKKAKPRCYDTEPSECNPFEPLTYISPDGTVTTIS